KLSDQLNFKPHHYGPHSYEAQYVLENLEAEGFIETFNDEILITDEGDEVYHDLKKEFSKDQIEFYKYVKDFY
ncbi:hypothetical protein HOK76_06510, partial [archaeon]|nr:hypothetical protein [archaeon]